MKHALLGALSTLLLPFSAHTAASSAGGYLMRGGYQPRSYMRMGQGDAVTSLPLGKATSREQRPGIEQSSDTLDIQRHAGITELVVIDSSVQDRATLYAGLNPGVGVVEIDAGHPGLPQLVQALRGYRGLAAIHVVSHASPGALQLGSSRITAESLHAELGALQALRTSVREGADLLFYGCDLAATDDGEVLLDIIRDQSGMDVAASSNLTGAAAQGGDWLLEVQRGDIRASLAFSEKALRDYSGVLAASAGVKAFSSGWTDNNINLTSTDFIVTGWDAGGSPIGNVSIYAYAPHVAYLQNQYNTSTTGTYFKVAADGMSTGTFELTGLEAGEAPALGGQFTNVRIVGIKPDDSIITSVTLSGTTAEDETFSFGPSQLAAFNGVKLKAFKLVFDTSSGSGTKPYFEFRNFTIAGALAPLALPLVSDARISITGANGLDSSYKIGDTITATWNNTNSGDNNAGITGVTMDFSEFGGGSAVAASDSGGTWTATYTISSGSIDATNRNISVSATNAAGTTTTADTTNATVDNKPPSVSSIAVSGSPSATDTSMAFTVTFNEAVTNVSTDDFTLVGTGSATGTIASVSASNGSSVNVNIASISGNGTLKVNLNGSTNIVDDAGNSIPSYSSGSTHTVAIPVAPGAPTIGTATAGDAQATVTFTAPGNGGSPITTYTATANPGRATGSCAGPSACVISIGNLTNGTAYTFSVTATNASGTGSASGTSNSVTPMANQIITFTQPSSYNFGATPTLTASSAYTVSEAATGFAIDFTSSTTGVCMVTSGGALTFVSAGTCTIDADQAGNASTNAASTVTRSFTVNAIAPSAPGIGSATAGDQQASVTFSAPASNGGATTTGYTVTANPGGNTGTGSSSPVTVTGLTNGVPYTFSVTATNSAGTGAASLISNSVVPAAPQTINFANPGSQNFGTSPTLTATADSNLDVTFTSATTGVCTITSYGVLAFVTAGSCTILADQAGDSSYLPATQVSRTFTVNATVAGAPASVVATAGDTQVSVAFTAPTTTGGASITGYTVTVSPADVAPVNGAGSPIVVTGLTNGQSYTFTVTADNSAGTGPASGASGSVIPAAAQTITFNNPGAQNFGTTPTLSATSDSGLTPAFTSSTTAVCTITTGGALTFVTAGTCTINADQAGNASYLAASQVTRSFTVNAVVAGAPQNPVATASDGAASVAFDAPSFSGGAAITGYTVAVIPADVSPVSASSSPIAVAGLTNGRAYEFTITANNSAGAGPASSPSNAVTPTANQTITFTNPGPQNFGTSPTLTATTDSGAAVTFTSGSTSVCTITSVGALSFLTVGNCTIHADQSGDASFTAATRVSQSFAVQAVVPAAPVIGVATMTSATAAEVQFTAPAFDGGATITQYEVVPSPAVAGGPFVGNSSPVAVDGLTAGQSYTFSVLARNSAGDSPASAVSNALQPMAAQTISFSVAGSYDFGTTPTLSATSSSGLPVRLAVDAGSASVCAITNEVLSFASVGTCTVHADQAGDASHDPAARVSQSFIVQAVVPAAPAIGSATMLSETSAEVSFTVPAFDGGAAITGYQVLPHPATVGGATYVGTGSPIRVTGLTKGVHYSFAVVAINSVGEGAASALSNTLFMVPLLEAHPVTQNVAYGTATEITPSVTGAYQAVTVIVGPGNGSADVLGTRLTYTPTLGYVGPDSFTYAVMDGYSSATATVDVMVGPPSLSMDSGVPDAVASSVYQHQLVTHGGIEGYSYVVTSGSLPPGVKLSDAGLLSGTPTQTGNFTFTVSSTDSSTGAGPFTVAQGYTLVVTNANLELATSELTTAFGGQHYRMQLYSQGGTAPYSYSIADGQLPAGLSLSAGGEISGVPEMAGTFAFTAQVTDANGFADTASLSLKVEAGLQVIHDMATDPAEPVFATAGTFVVSAQGGQSGNPLVYGSGSPAICSVAGNVVTMLDAGTCVLTIDQAGNGQYLAAQQAVLHVEIAAAAPSLTWLDGINKVYGEAAFDLPDPSSNSAGAFSFSSSDTGVATISGRTVTLVGEGSATLTAHQAAQGGYTAASVELNLTVNARPDPTADANVRGSLQAQVDASVRFSRVQLGNIQSRLQQVRSGGNPSSATLTLAYAGDLLGQALSVPVQLPVNQFTGMPSGWGGWMSGTATFGSSGQQQGGGFDFNTDGISLGVDRRYGDNGLLGMAASLGRNRSRLDNSPSRMDADQYSLAVYGLWRAGEHVFVDGVLAQGRLDFDIARWSDDANAIAVGQRDGSQTFGALTFGYQQQHGATTLSGYGRFDGSQTHLDGYREHGLQAYDLAYARQTVRNSGLALGFDGSYSWQGERLQLRPFWKLEYRQSLSNNGDAWMNYVQQPSTDGYLLKMQGYADNMLTAGLGLDMQTRNGWLISLLFGRDQGSNSASSNSVGLRISYGKGGGGVGMGAADGARLDDCQGRRCRRGAGVQGQGEQNWP
ncbi:fibronectin type III domain-containing protein [Stenotrophomonas sp.]|uniref:fibronectin type III domain-containing protein n=1 Tax=Stenotrophomonas sp. TaxID=69392 RepID=UPI0028AEF1B0|nr:fibronectin type III domain-containing protein [Stenotrophomonas sp.]